MSSSLLSSRSLALLLNIIGASFFSAFVFYIIFMYCNCSTFRACGTVYIARDNETDEVVAIKIVSLQQDQKQLGLIVKEIEALTTLEHKNIINYRGSYRINQTLWIVMDYLEGMIMQSNRGNWTLLKLANAVWVYIHTNYNSLVLGVVAPVTKSG